jgi:hypothetical protein
LLLGVDWDSAAWTAAEDFMMTLNLPSFGCEIGHGTGFGNGQVDVSGSGGIVVMVRSFLVGRWLGNAGAGNQKCVVPKPT